MASIIITKGIVLQQMPIKDQDKRIVLFSADYGKMIVFANGAKRAKSPLLAGTQPFVFGEFHLVESRNSYTLKQVEIIESFYSLREDLTTLSYALYLLEVTLSIIQEMDQNEDLLRLLYISLHTLKQGKQVGKIVRRVFEFRLLNSLGYAPDLSQCMLCKKDHEVYGLSTNGGLICSDCKQMIQPFSKETLEVLRYIQSVPYKKLYHFVLDELRFEELSKVINDYFRYFVHQKFKSLDIINED